MIGSDGVDACSVDHGKVNGLLVRMQRLNPDVVGIECGSHEGALSQKHGLEANAHVRRSLLPSLILAEEKTRFSAEKEHMCEEENMQLSIRHQVEKEGMREDSVLPTTTGAVAELLGIAPAAAAATTATAAGSAPSSSAAPGVVATTATAPAATKASAVPDSAPGSSAATAAAAAGSGEHQAVKPTDRAANTRWGTVPKMRRKFDEGAPVRLRVLRRAGRGDASRVPDEDEVEHMLPAGEADVAALGLSTVLGDRAAIGISAAVADLLEPLAGVTKVMQSWTASCSSVKAQVMESIDELERVAKDVENAPLFSKWKDKVKECEEKGVRIKATSKRTDGWILETARQLGMSLVSSHRDTFPEDKDHVAMDGTFDANHVRHPSADAGATQFAAHFKPHWDALLDRHCWSSTEETPEGHGFPWPRDVALDHLSAFARRHFGFASKAVTDCRRTETARLADVATARSLAVSNHDRKLEVGQKAKEHVQTKTCLRTPVHLLAAAALRSVAEQEEDAGKKKWPAAVRLLATWATKSHGAAQVESGWSDLDDDVTSQRQGMTMEHVEQMQHVNQNGPRGKACTTLGHAHAIDEMTTNAVDVFFDVETKRRCSVAAISPRMDPSLHRREWGQGDADAPEGKALLAARLDEVRIECEVLRDARMPRPRTWSSVTSSVGWPLWLHPPGRSACLPTSLRTTERPPWSPSACA